MKFATQLFGDRMVVANATGCTRVWSNMYPHNSYNVRQTDGKGSAYGHSFNEDNVEFGYGIARASQTRRTTLKKKL